MAEVSQQTGLQLVYVLVHQIQNDSDVKHNFLAGTLTNKKNGLKCSRTNKQIIKMRLYTSFYR